MKANQNLRIWSFITLSVQGLGVGLYQTNSISCSTSCVPCSPSVINTPYDASDNPCPRFWKVISKTCQHGVLTLNCKMSLTYTSTARCCSSALRNPWRPLFSASTSASQQRQRAPTRQWESTAASSASNPKITGIVDQISHLTLLETADLVSNLKV